MRYTTVRTHQRRKPAKPPIYIETHNRLRADVEAMRRGELRPYRSPGVLQALAKAIRVIVGSSD